MCGVFFCCFHVCSCVACFFSFFSMIFLCVHVWCMFFNDFLACSCVVCCFSTFSCVFTCGVCFSMIFLCVHVWCVSLLFSRGQKTDDSFGGEGQIKFVSNTFPALVTFFSAPPPHSQTKRQMMLQRGGSNRLKMSPALVTFFSPPPPRYETLTQIMDNYGIS